MATGGCFSQALSQRGSNPWAGPLSLWQAPRLQAGDMAGRIEGKLAVVTGAGSGIGRATAARFAAEGAALLANDIPASGLATLASELRARGARVETQVADISVAANAEAAAQLAVARFDRLDIWVNNAGGAAPRKTRGDRRSDLVPGVRDASYVSGATLPVDGAITAVLTPPRS